MSQSVFSRAPFAFSFFGRSPVKTDRDPLSQFPRNSSSMVPGRRFKRLNPLPGNPRWSAEQKLATVPIRTVEGHPVPVVGRTRAQLSFLPVRCQANLEGCQPLAGGGAQRYSRMRGPRNGTLKAVPARGGSRAAVPGSGPLAPLQLALPRSETEMRPRTSYASPSQNDHEHDE